MSELITPQNGLKSDLKRTEIRDKIITQVNKFEDINKYKLDNEFIKLICNLIEYHIKKKYNINKKDLFFDIYSRFFPDLNDEEKQTIAKIIQFIHDNSHIQKLPYRKLFLSFIEKWIKKDLINFFLFNPFKNTKMELQIFGFQNCIENI